MMNNNRTRFRMAGSRLKFGMLLVSTFMLIGSNLHAQERTVSGRVIDVSTNEGLPGTAVVVKGTTNGAVTDIDGNYKLSVGENAILVFSFVGYKTQEIVVGNQSTINISMEEDVSQLSEVVVVGYGQIEKKDVTGSIANIDTKEFNRGVITSPERLLAGKVAGVQITSNGGEPGGGSFIRIRGATSLSASSTPLIVIDGVPVDENRVAGGRNPLNFVNPSDISDITVLKDASASAIYGSRAANGVIIITTKSGESGKIKINYDGFYSVSTFIGDAGQLSPNNFRATVANKAPQRLNSLGNSSTDWVKEVTQPATGLKQMLSVSGGNDNHNFYTSVNYLKNDGVLKTSENNNVNLSLKYNGKLLNDNLKVKVNAKYGSIKNRFAANVMGTAMGFDPTQPVMDGNPETGGYYQWDVTLAPRNPVATLDLIDNRGENNRILGNIELEYALPFINGLSVKSNLSTDISNGVSRYLNPRLLNIHTGAAADSGRYSNYTDKRTSKLLEVYGIYKRELESIDSKIDVTGGYSWQGFEFDSEGYQVIRLENGFTEETPFNGTILEEEDSVFSENRLISFFGRVNYQFKDKYLLTANIRRDGSTRFGENNRWGIFPSLALGWRIMDEQWMESLSGVFSDLKFRVGWGVIGNQGIDDYLYLPLYTPSENDAQYQFGYNTDGSPRFVSMIRPNGIDPNIKWEETETTNIGLDFGILDGRVYGSVDYYIKNTTDLLSEIAFPAGITTGDVIVTNVGEMENKGIELLLNSTIIDKKDLQFSATFNIAYNKNTIKKLDNSNLPDFTGYEVGGISGNVGQNIQVLKVGYAANSFRMYKQIYDDNGNPVFGTQASMYEDANGDSVVTTLDRVINKSPDPKIMMGLTTNLSYKNFDLGLTLRSSLGNYVYNNVSSSQGFYGRITEGSGNNNNIHESSLATNFNTMQLFSDYYLEDASFLKLDNITLGYNKAFEQVNLRVYTTFQNVFTLTGYSGVDPEISNGIDNNIYPRSLSMLLGVSINY